jgi:predicted flap endonuclease-1-like 5' DNA nuclease
VKAELARKQEQETKLEAAQRAAQEQLRDLKAELAGKQEKERELEAALGAAQEQLHEFEAQVAALQKTGGPSGDDLKAIRGIGPSFERALHALGVCSYAQIAAWGDEQIAEVAAQLRTQPTRIRREGWVESAQQLSLSQAAGD